MFKMKTKIRAVIFDVGGVLEIGRAPGLVKRGKSFLNMGVHEEISKKFKIPVDQWFDATDTTYADSIEGKISEQKAISIIAKNIKTTPGKLRRVVIKAYKNHFDHNKELYKFAFKLKKKAYKIVILSDQWYLSKEALIKKKYAKRFDAVVVSCDVGIRKPNPKIYRFVLKKLKTPAKQCVFIDNQEWNIKPAKKIGMKTILFKDNKQTIKSLKKLGVGI